MNSQSRFLNTDNICFSGGAAGADVEWGIAAKSIGHDVIHFSFKGHKSHGEASETYILSEDDLKLADPYLETANKTLKRYLPFYKPWIINLLRRNWYQVRDTNAVYAISSLDKKSQVSGGTAWATQMFIDNYYDGQKSAYLFDQEVGQWYTWRDEWLKIANPLKPTGFWTGIGTRTLNICGKKALTDLVCGNPELSENSSL